MAGRSRSRSRAGAPTPTTPLQPPSPSPAPVLLLLLAAAAASLLPTGRAPPADAPAAKRAQPAAPAARQPASHFLHAHLCAPHPPFSALAAAGSPSRPPPAPTPFRCPTGGSLRSAQDRPPPVSLRAGAGSPGRPAG